LRGGSRPNNPAGFARRREDGELQRFARLDEFVRTLDRLAGEGGLGVAVSGGPDSLALLLLAAEARPGQIRAATVDHRLRAESADEAAQVGRLCASLGVAHDVLTVAIAPGASLQALARQARYAALEAWTDDHGLAAMATAHHADDQAETLLMRLARGSGVGGLRGIREKRALGPGSALIRPLLGFRKAELIAVVEGAGWSAINDPSNGDDRHDRTRVRALLADNPWLEPERLARSAAALGEADDALNEAVEQARSSHWVSAGGGVSLRDVYDLPREIRRRLLLSALGVMQTAPSGPEVNRLIAALDDGRAATVGAAKVTPQPDGVWRIEIAPPRRGA
jgi:tRNA(Ile)-lysidine synthase